MQKKVPFLLGGVLLLIVATGFMVFREKAPATVAVESHTHKHAEGHVHATQIANPDALDLTGQSEVVMSMPIGWLLYWVSGVV